MVVDVPAALLAADGLQTIELTTAIGNVEAPLTARLHRIELLPIEAPITGP